jgi:hypothetical protein
MHLMQYITSKDFIVNVQKNRILLVYSEVLFFNEISSYWVYTYVSCRITQIINSNDTED